MPPDVGRPGSATSVPHTPSSESHKVESKGTTTTKSTSDSATQPKKDDQDPKAAAKATQGAKQNATQQKSHNHTRAQVVQKDLQKQIPVVNRQKELEQPPEASGLKKGESISARVDNKPDGFRFEFERPITKEQAGAIIFHKGKVPGGASLEGSGKNWVVKLPNNVDERLKTISQFTKHTETTKPVRNSEFPSDSELKFKWVGGDLLTPNQRMEHVMEENEKKIKEVMGSIRG
jgi:hypothetical protein